MHCDPRREQARNPTSSKSEDVDLDDGGTQTGEKRGGWPSWVDTELRILVFTRLGRPAALNSVPCRESAIHVSRWRRQRRPCERQASWIRSPDARAMHGTEWGDGRWLVDCVVEDRARQTSPAYLLIELVEVLKARTHQNRVPLRLLKPETALKGGIRDKSVETQPARPHLHALKLLSG